MRKKSLLFLSYLVLLSGCNAHYLNVQTQYLTTQNLASSFVDTPDPRQDCPEIGQRLLIQWSFPQEYLCCDDLHLNLKVRFRNRQTQEVDHPIFKKRGTYLFEVYNEDYINSGGIAAYKVDLFGGDSIIETWKHPLWAELISF